jgi:hypothetical protein
VVRTAGRRLVAGGSVSSPLFLGSHEDNHRHREAPFLSLWAIAQDLELPACWPRRAIGRAPDPPHRAGRHPAPRVGQSEPGPLCSHSPPAHLGSDTRKENLNEGSDSRAGVQCSCSESFGSRQITNLLLLPSLTRGHGSSKKGEPTPQRAAMREEGGSEGQ